MRHSCYFMLIALLTACSSTPPAPVVDRLPNKKPSAASTPTPAKKATPTRPTYKAGDWRPDSYMVKKGDTLFSIGLEYGYYYKDIAQANNIAVPFNINVGQTLKFSALKEKSATETKPAASASTNADGVEITPINTESSSTVSAIKPPTIVAITEPKATREPYSDEALKKPLPVIAKPAVAKPAIEKPAAEKPSVEKPVTEKPVVEKPSPETAKPTADNKPEAKPESKVETKPSAEPNEDIDWAWPTKGKVIANFNEASNKGLDIAGTAGQAVNAAASGKVIYSGSDLRGYGKLVIIKHNPNYLSVYAHNSLILVKEGQQVTRGQKIAEMGNTDSNTVKLHFEIRRQGKSVDPSKYLTSN